MNKYEAVIFDLDGTLIDSSKDLIKTLNDMLEIYQRPTKDYKQLRNLISYGSSRLLQVGFDGKYPKDFSILRNEFLDLYNTQNTNQTKYFDDIENLLNELDKAKTPWAIVTNKPTKPTMQIAKALGFDKRAKAIVCGDTLLVAKPDPAPILLSCDIMNVTPKNCIYLGDCDSDIISGRRAGLQTVACAYGFIDPKTKINSWQADYIVNKPFDICNLL